MLIGVRSLARRLLARPSSLLEALTGDRHGSTAIEYTIIAGLLSVAIVASFGQITAPLGDLFTTIGSSFKVK